MLSVLLTLFLFAGAGILANFRLFENQLFGLPKEFTNFLLGDSKYESLNKSKHEFHIITNQAINPIYQMFDSPQKWYQWLRHRDTLPIFIDDNEPIRLNIVMTQINDLTGGPLSIMHFAVLAAKAGIVVRWINIYGAGTSYEYLLDRLKKYEGLEQFGELVSYVHHGFATQMRTNSRDIFMGTIWFTASIASATQKNLRNPNILYFIQDYEAIFSPHDSSFVEASESYDLPHFAVFSTSFLSDFFKEKKLGVYKGSRRLGDSRSFVSEPVVKPFRLDGHTRIGRQHNSNAKRRLIIYARPHKPRNAYELAIAALSESVRLHVLDPAKWELVGVGAAKNATECNLGDRGKAACIRLIKNIPEPSYKRLLAGADIGFSLMISPHPSLPPFDFAAAGMVVVTNSFETKTQETLGKVSSNLIAAEPTLIGIVNGIAEAVLRIDNVEQREKGSKLNWPTSWDDERCYGQKLFSKVKTWFSEKSIYPFELKTLKT